MACPNQGCPARVLRGALAEHRRRCPHGARQHCPLGCGASLGPAERARHNCYRELREAWSQRRERGRGLVRGLLRRVRKVHRATSFLRRQLAQLGDLLREDDALTVAAPPEEPEATPEGGTGAEAGRAQGLDTL